MSLQLPENSRITVGSRNGYPAITIPQRKAGIGRFFIGVFLIFWLCGWAVGWTTAAAVIATGKGDLFMLVWIGGWTLGGLFAIYMLYRLFRRAIPETLLLNRPSLSLDTGIAPLRLRMLSGFHRDYWRELFPKRVRIDLPEHEILTIRLRETGEGNRLTVDHGSDRIDIAKSATEIEREWLFAYLKENYRIQDNAT